VVRLPERSAGRVGLPEGEALGTKATGRVDEAASRDSSAGKG